MQECRVCGDPLTRRHSCFSKEPPRPTAPPRKTERQLTRLDRKGRKRDTR